MGKYRTTLCRPKVRSYGGGHRHGQRMSSTKDEDVDETASLKAGDGDSKSRVEAHLVGTNSAAPHLG